MGVADTVNVNVSYGVGSVKISPDGTLTFAGKQGIFNLPTLFNEPMVYAKGMSGATGTGAAIKIAGNVEFTGGTLTHNGKNIGSDHKHSGVQSGGSNTGNPV
jgi:hypothetical protein